MKNKPRDYAWDFAPGNDDYAWDYWQEITTLSY